MPFKDPGRKKEWQREYQRKLYSGHGPKKRSKSVDKAYNARKYKRGTEIINGNKKNGCSVCGENRLPCLDFHHMRPEEKDKGVSSFRQYGPVKLILEISKCVVLCSNCHRLLHWGQRESSPCLTLMCEEQENG